MRKEDFKEEDLEIILARTVEQARHAFQVRYKVFGKEGYLVLSEHNAGMEMENYDLLPESALFVAYYSRVPIGTVRLIIDTKEYGIPHFKKVSEFQTLRKESKLIAEGSRLAILPEFRNVKDDDDMNPVMHGLLKADIIWGMQKGATDIVSVGNMGTNRGFNVAEQVFIKQIGYVQFSEPFLMGEFQEYAMPLHLNPMRIHGQFRKYMERSHKYIQPPYDHVTFSADIKQIL